jgi:hypothetical protein
MLRIEWRIDRRDIATLPRAPFKGASHPTEMARRPRSGVTRRTRPQTNARSPRSQRRSSHEVISRARRRTRSPIQTSGSDRLRDNLIALGITLRSARPRNPGSGTSTHRGEVHRTRSRLPQRCRAYLCRSTADVSDGHESQRGSRRDCVECEQEPWLPNERGAALLVTEASSTEVH